MLFSLLGLGPAAGRLAVRSPRVSEVIDTALDLLNLFDLAKFFDLPAIQKLSKELDDIDRRRNLVAHNVWFHVSGTDMYCVQVLMSDWVVPGGTSKNKVPRRVEPEARHITLDYLSNLAAAARERAGAIAQMHIAIAQLLAALPPTHRVQLDPMVHPVQLEPEPPQHPPFEM